MSTQLNFAISMATAIISVLLSGGTVVLNFIVSVVSGSVLGLILTLVDSQPIKSSIDFFLINSVLFSVLNVYRDYTIRRFGGRGMWSINFLLLPEGCSIRVCFDIVC